MDDQKLTLEELNNLAKFFDVLIEIDSQQPKEDQ